MSDEKKIFIDDDWKSQVAAEKETLRQEASAAQQAGSVPPAGTPTGGESSSSGQAAAGSPAGGSSSTGTPSVGDPTQMPPASFEMLVTTLATEAMVALGQFPNPATQEVAISIEHATYAIEMLAMLEEKTKGNLTPAEGTMLTDLLHQLRMMFVATQQSPPRPDA